MVYYKNRKKTGTPIQIPLRNLISLLRIDEETTDVISGKEWAYQFYLITTSRSYDLRAYSWNDREVWLKGLNKLLDYKKAILEKRGVSMDELDISISKPPSDEKYNLKPYDFGYGGKVLPLSQIITVCPEKSEEIPDHEDAKFTEEEIRVEQNQENQNTSNEENRGSDDQIDPVASGEVPEDKKLDEQVVKVNCEDGSAKSYSDTYSERNPSSHRSIDSGDDKKEAQPSKFGK